MVDRDLRLLPGRRRWLKRLDREGMISSRAGHGQAPMYCMRAGWSEWVYHREETDETMGEAELAAAYPDLWRGSDFRNFAIVGEQMTEAGREALDAARAQSAGRAALREREGE